MCLLLHAAETLDKSAVRLCYVNSNISIIGVRSVYLLGKSRELEHIKCLIEAGRALINVDYHADPSRTTEEDLQEVG